MKGLTQRKTTRLHGFDYNAPGVYFLTLCTENKRCLLSVIIANGVKSDPSVKLLPYGEIAEKYINQLNHFYEEISVESYVIMPNHIHILLKVHEGGPSGTPVPTAQNSTVSRFVSTFKRFCNKEYGKNIWQYRSYDHVIRDQEDYDRHIKYIHENPFKWESDEFYT